MDLQFGESVKKESLKLESQGNDSNQVAKILFDRDEQGYNYGIGIILDGNGQPMASSSTLREYAFGELGTSTLGNYMNSAKIMEEVKAVVLRWQRIPEKHWDRFKIALPSDAGTGAVKAGVEIALMLNPDVQTLGIEELG